MPPKPNGMLVSIIRYSLLIYWSGVEFVGTLLWTRFESIDLYGHLYYIISYYHYNRRENSRSKLSHLSPVNSPTTSLYDPNLKMSSVEHSSLNTSDISDITSLGPISYI